MSIHEVSARLTDSGVAHVVVIAQDGDFEKILALAIKTRKAIDDANTAVNSGRIGEKTFKAMKKSQSLVQKLGKISKDFSYDDYCDNDSAYRNKLKAFIAQHTKTR